MTRTVAAGVVVLGLASCTAVVPTCAGAPAPAQAGEVVATVNGVRITARDLRLEAGGHGGSEGDEVLQAVVRRELLAQEALRRGLDSDPAYRSAVADAEARLTALRRRTL